MEFAFACAYVNSDYMCFVMDICQDEEPLCCKNYGIMDCSTAFQAPVVSKLIHFSY